MRGKHDDFVGRGLALRITPACAGKTTYPRTARGAGADHPRVCGENKALTEAEREQGGSPPRVRGKHLQL